MKRWADGITLMILTAMFAPNATAGSCEAKSGNAKVALLELYTSEGCDSCPPADRWLSELPKRGFDTNRVVPLAFHVDYWNYLGWTDPFSQPQYTERQRTFARRTNASTVYTPEVLVNGREYRRWSRNDLDVELQRSGVAGADISLKLKQSASTLVIYANAMVRDANKGELYIALYENNLQTAVKAGENRGRTLEHAFVVRQLIGPFAADKNGKTQMQETLALRNSWKSKDLGVAAFVQETDGTAIFQALALPICPG